jgi:hypothetical protein
LPPFAGICRTPQRSLTFSYSLPWFFAVELFWPAMTEMAQPKRGGTAFHSILEPHFDFIHQLRQRRKTWQEIAELLLTEKGIHVTLYAPYRFYRRHLQRRAKGHWEEAENHSQPAHLNTAASRLQSRPAPLPASPDFKRPDLSRFNMDEFT